MKWHEEAARFDELELDDVLDFASPDIKAEAVSRYNRAIGQIKSGNGDIASIAIRQLASAYPDFTEAVLLNACCQMAWGEAKVALDGLDMIDKVEYLSEEERFRTDLYLKAVRADIAEAEERAEMSQTLTRGIGREAIPKQLHRDEQYMKQLSEGGDAKKILIHTGAKRSFPVLPALAGLVVVLAIVFLGVRFLPALWQGGSESSTEESSSSTTLETEETTEETTVEATPTPIPTPTSLPTPTPIIPPGDAGPDSDDTDRLAWLLAALTALSPEDEGYQALLDQYMALFEPTPTPTEETTTTETTTTQPPTTTTTAPTTVAATPTPVPATSTPTQVTTTTSTTTAPTTTPTTTAPTTSETTTSSPTTTTGESSTTTTTAEPETPPDENGGDQEANNDAD